MLVVTGLSATARHPILAGPDQEEANNGDVQKWSDPLPAPIASSVSPSNTDLTHRSPSVGSVSMLPYENSTQSSNSMSVIQNLAELSNLDTLIPQAQEAAQQNIPSDTQQIEKNASLTQNIPSSNLDTAIMGSISNTSSYAVMGTSMSSTSSSFLSASEIPPSSIHINSEFGTSTRNIAVSKSLNSAARNILFAENNGVLDDNNDELEEDLKQERKSSKRAMSSSLDEYSKVKARISLVKLKPSTNSAIDDSLSDINNSISVDEDSRGKSFDLGTNVPTAEGKSTCLNTLQFNDINPFDHQFSYFSSYRCIPSLTHCKLLSNEETIFSLLNYYNKRLPDVEKLFPWLHGIHKLNYGQISFLSNSINPSKDRKPRIISFERPASLDENNSSLDEYSDEENADENEEVEKNDINEQHQIEGTTPSRKNRSLNETHAKRDGGLNEDKEEALDDITELTKTPDVRFLMPVRSCNTNGEISPNYASIITESTGLIKGTVLAEDVLVSYSNIVNLELYLQGILPNEVFKFYHPETIITDCIITQLIPVFKNLDPEIGINLRNFHIQVSKISHVSDFIVYCFNQEDHEYNVNQTEDAFVNNKCKCVSLSRLLHIAQIVYQKQHPELIGKNDPCTYLNNKKYNTFILADPNIEALDSADLMSIQVIDETSSLKRDDELCTKYDISVFNNWDSNYLYRERLEISKMSTATPLSNNLWLGNITDYECLQIQLSNGKNVQVATRDEVERIIKNQSVSPLYCNAENTIVKLTKHDFEGVTDSEESDRMLITFPLIIWKFYIKCVEGARIPTLDQLRLIYDNFKDCDFINIEFPPSGSLSLADMSDDDILSIINICKFCYYICDSNFPGLIYCSDGYTESSLLFLCYLMYSENICLDEAILKLHMDYGRPFFIFKTDYILLSKLETIMNKFSPLISPEETKEDFAFEENSKSIRSSLLMPKRKKSVGQVGINNGTNTFGNPGFNTPSSFVTSTGHHVVQYRGNQNLQLHQPRSNHSLFNRSNMMATADRRKKCTERTTPSIDGCFGEVHGSLPSRILKHLYLGSLTHASSIPLLSRLKINYIVSVGERISWCDTFKHQKEVHVSGSEVITFTEGQYDESTGYELGVKKVLILPNINDDGIGTLINTIDHTLDFINECYERDGRTLVHCQVGVSRSATVCIGEVMKRLKLSLARAYMYVRVRRLNVIIQPNLKLMYELFKWEESLLSKKSTKWKKINIESKTEDNPQDFEVPDICDNKRNGSVSSTSTIFTNHLGKSERSSISTTRGNSISSSNGCGINIGFWNNSLKMKFIGSICEEPEQDYVIESEGEDEDIGMHTRIVGRTAANDSVVRFEDGAGHKFIEEKEYDVVSNSKGSMREVDWHILCREIHNLNRAYIKSG